MGTSSSNVEISAASLDMSDRLVLWREKEVLESRLMARKVTTANLAIEVLRTMWNEPMKIIGRIGDKELDEYATLKRLEDGEIARKLHMTEDTTMICTYLIIKEGSNHNPKFYISSHKY
jgi:hypothetical protein